jgi:hypothetical protein
MTQPTNEYVVVGMSGFGSILSVEIRQAVISILMKLPSQKIEFTKKLEKN